MRPAAVVAAVVAVLCLMLGTVAARPAAGQESSAPAVRHPVTTLDAAPADFYGVYYDTSPNPFPASYPQGFTDQTLRQVVQVPTAGNTVRVVLSNAFGYEPLTVTAATIARRAGGAAVVPGTSQALTVHGHRSFTIPAGEQIQTDVATIAVRPFKDLAVSLAFDGATGPPTDHYIGPQASYVSAAGSGDVSGSVSGLPFTATTPMRFFLTGVQVLGAPPTNAAVVAAGDSTTHGGEYQIDTATRWTDFLQQRLFAAGSPLSVVNSGINGNQVTHNAPPHGPGSGVSLESRFGHDVLDQPHLAGVIVFEGINDIGLTATPAQQLISGYRFIARRARRAGVPTLIATLTPMKGAFYDSPIAEATRTTVNDWIRQQHLFDGVVDFAKAVADPHDPSRLDPAYDSGDHLHPNAEGFAAMARIVDVASLQRLFGAAAGRSRQ